MNEPTPETRGPAAQPLEELELQRYLDGRLEAEAQRAVEERLKACAASRRTLDALREEAALLRAALENLSEPPVKIGDKVLAELYARHKRHVALQRARRLRHQVLAAVSAAALIMFGFWTLKPREEAARLVSGTAATLLREGTESLPLGLDARLYAGDRVVTGRGQFVRLRLAGGTRVDLDENSRLHFEKSGAVPVLALEAGSVGLQTASASVGLTLATPAGQVRAEGGTALDLRVLKPSGAQAPDWAGPWKALEVPGSPPSGSLYGLTVLEGKACLHAPGASKSLAVGKARRVLFGPARPPEESVEVGALHALDGRQEREAWAAGGPEGPQDRACLGLTQIRDWSELGRSLGLTEEVFKSPAVAQAVQAALRTLTEAAGFLAPAERAAGLGQGQQALRAATQGWSLQHEIRWHPRVLEGLAHYERGRALLALGAPKDLSDAHSAFLASAVAFEEALLGSEAAEPDPEQAPGLAKRGLHPKVTGASRWRDFTSSEQALFLARFYQPWAVLWTQQLAAGAPGARETPVPRAWDAERLFELSGQMLGRSVESLGALYGQALARTQAGRLAEALALLDELAATSVAGLAVDSPSRACTEGLRQAAHVERVRLCLRLDDRKKTDNALREFWVRYPLETQGRAGRALQDLLNGCRLRQGQEALLAGRYPEAVWAYDEILAHGSQVLGPARLLEVQTGLLEALLGAADAERAIQVARELERQDLPASLDPVARIRSAALIDKAKALFARSPQAEPQAPVPHK